MAGDICTTVNMHLNASWSSGAIPVATSLTIIKSGLTGVLIDTGATEAGLDLGMIMTEPGCIASYGSAVAPIVTAADLVQIYGSGGFYLDCHNNGAAVKTDRVNVMAANKQVPIILGSAAAANAGDYVKIVCYRGNVTLKSGIKFEAGAQVIVRHIDSLADVMLTIASGAELLPVLTMEAGTCVSGGAITLAKIEKDATMTQDSAVITTADVAGTLRMDHGFDTAALATGTPIATLIEVHSGGLLDLVTPDNTLYKEITDVVVFPGGRFRRNSSMHVVTNGVTDYTGGRGILAA